jgi:ATP-binding cassette subfamily B protein
MYLQDLFDFFALEPTIKSKAQSQPFPSPLKQGFSFENVSFKYPGSERWAIKDLSFHLPAGKKMALVGENGAGKRPLSNCWLVSMNPRRAVSWSMGWIFATLN